MGSTVLLLEKCSLSFLFKRHYLSKVFYFQIWHDCYVFSPQARIWVCRADWTSLFPLREEIKSTLTVVLALLNRTLKTHKSHICSENCFEVFVKDQSGRVVEPESVLLLITVLTVSVGFVPEWKQMNKCIVKFLFYLTCEEWSCSHWAIRGQQEHTNTAQTSFHTAQHFSVRKRSENVTWTLAIVH